MIRNQALEFALMEILRQRRKRCCALGGLRERSSPSQRPALPVCEVKNIKR